MDIRQLDIALLDKAKALLEKKNAFLAKVEEIEGELAALFSGKELHKVDKNIRRGKSVEMAALEKLPLPKVRGGIINAVIPLLKDYPDGLAISEISKRTGIPDKNLRVWCSSTGKRLGVIRISPGVYGMKDLKRGAKTSERGEEGDKSKKDR